MERHARCRRQDFAVRVAVLHLDQQARRAFHGRQLLYRDRGGAGVIQVERTCGCRTRRFGRRGSSVVIRIERRPEIQLGARSYARLHRRPAEAVIGIVGERHAARLDSMAYLHGQSTRRSARQVSHRGIELCRRGRDERLLRRRQHGAHQRHAERFHPELGVGLAFPSGPDQPVDSQLRFRRDLPHALGHTLVIELRAQFHLLAAADVFDFRDARQIAGARHHEPGAGRHARDMLHADRLARAEQRAVEHGVYRERQPAGEFRAQVEVPRPYAVVPVRVREGEILAQAREGDEDAAIVALAFGHLRGRRQLALRPDGAVRPGPAFEPELAAAVAHRDPRAGHRLAAVERGNPRERALSPVLEVHGKVRDQHAGGDVVGLVLSVQRAAQPRARQLDDVEPRLRERYPDHLHLPVRARPRQIESGRFVLFVDRGALAFPRKLAGRLARLVVAQECAETPDDLRLVVDDAHRAAGYAFSAAFLIWLGKLDPESFQGRFHVAHGDREHRLGVQLEDAEAPRKLDERRILIGAGGKRERRLVLRLAPRVVAEVPRQLHGELCFLRERSLELDRFHRLDVGIERGLPGLAPARQPHAGGGLTRHGGIEIQDDGRHRQARGVLVRTLAGELHDESRPHAEGKALRRFPGKTRLRRDLRAQHQPHLRARGQPPRAAHRHHRQPGKTLVLDLEARDGHHAPVALEVHAKEVVGAVAIGGDQLARLLLREQRQGDALVDARGLAPRVLEGRRVGGGIEGKQESLFLVYALVTFPRQGGHRRGSAGMKPEFLLPLDRLPGYRREIRVQRELATLSRGQIGVEVVNPVLLVRPAPAAFQPLRITFAADRKRIGKPRIAKRDHGFGEAHQDLPHALRLALRGEGLDLRRGPNRARSHACDETCQKVPHAAHPTRPGARSSKARNRRGTRR